MSRLAQLERLHAEDPGDADIPYMVAQEYAAARDYTRAVRWFESCLAIDPNYHYAYFHKARAHQALGDIAAAAKSLEEGLARSTRSGHTKAAQEIAGFMRELEGGA